MQYLITPQTGNFEHSAWWEGEFSEDQLDWLQEKTKNSSIPAAVGSNGGETVRSDVRRTLVSWLNIDDDNKWVYEKLAHVTESLNSKFFNFNLTTFGEPCQLTNYLSSDNGMYDWHIDMGGCVSRKLSVVLQLSHPEEYEGGDLELLYSNETIKVSKKRGKIVVFPSWTLHRVTPVTGGSRQSLVLWASGPKFR